MKVFDTHIARVNTSDLMLNDSSTVIWSRTDLVRLGDVIILCDNEPHDGGILPSGEHTIEYARLQRWARLSMNFNLARLRIKSRSYAPYERL